MGFKLHYLLDHNVLLYSRYPLVLVIQASVYYKRQYTHIRIGGIIGPETSAKGTRKSIAGT